MKGLFVTIAFYLYLRTVCRGGIKLKKTKEYEKVMSNRSKIENSRMKQK